MVMDINI